MAIAHAYSFEVPALFEHHFDSLHHGTGISIDVKLDRGYRTVTTKKELAEAGFKPSQQNPPGLLMPVHPPDGSAAASLIGFWAMRN